MTKELGKGDRKDDDFGIAYGYVVEGYVGDGLCLRALQDKGCGAHVVALQTVHKDVSDDRLLSCPSPAYRLVT